MLGPEERKHILRWAYIPEHLPDYVTAVTGMEPFLFRNHVFYRRGDILVFVGYPLEGVFTDADLGECLVEATGAFRPGTISLIAPRLPDWKRPAQRGKEDAYYRIDLRTLHPRSKVRNMTRRASTEVACEKGGHLGEEHIRLIRDFIAMRKLEEGTRLILERVPDYVNSVPTAVVFSARERSGRLAGFTVAEYGAKDYGFYMFNFRSGECGVPGVSDLLLHEAMQTALAEGKTFMNLGLGIREGVAFFKKKWGAKHFLDYETCTYRLSSRQLLGRILGFMGRRT
ncbi:MAG: hypothetical protein AB1512_22885 [Thermodesulfobacteriota bacterium]